MIKSAFSPTYGLVALSAISVLQGCGSDNDSPPSSTTPPSTQHALSCDDSLKTGFKPDANTTVLLVKSFKKGDPLALAGTPSTPPPAVAPNDLCLVKLNVGPGNPGPASAPSTSAGIGIEVWLPSPENWNGRIHNIGGGGWAGGSQGSVTDIGAIGVNSSFTASGAELDNVAIRAATEGSVSASTDGGHTTASGSFGMNPDGSINTVLWEDFTERAQHEMAIKTKALAAAYYAKPTRFAYYDGCSQGGRQGYNEVQNHPDDYDGYLIGAPAVNWTEFQASVMYPWVVAQNDLAGVRVTDDQLNLVNGAAVSSCDQIGGQHLGYLTDPLSCKYDPTKDASILCAGSSSGGVIGTNKTSACVSPKQATAINKFWYGITADGSVPDPAIDNGSQTTLSPQQIFYGWPRGTDISVASLAASIATDTIALDLQDPTYGDASFINATGTGQNRWLSLSYSGFANAIYRGISLQPSFAYYDSNNPDLTAARAAGTKIIHYHGTNDQFIPVTNSLNYYSKVQKGLGGIAATQDVDRLFLVPGMGHCRGPGIVPAAAGPAVTANNLPSPVPGPMFFNALVDWVENRRPPASFTVSSPDGTRSQPLCMYPGKATYSGSGDIAAASSYSCK